MLKKIFLLLSIVFCVCGCSSVKKTETITFSTWGSATEIKIIKNIISDFEHENPDIKIELMHIPQNYFQKLHLLFASNTAPDVIFLNNIYLPLYASKLENLSDCVEVKNFYPQTIKGMSYNGYVLGVPRDISNLVLYINTDKLSENKLSVPNTNWTIEDFLRYSQKMTKNDFWGIGIDKGIYWTLPFLSYYGGGVLSDDFQIIIDDDNSQKGMKFYKDLKYRYKVMPKDSDIGSSTLAQMFENQQIGMYLSGRWMFPTLVQNCRFNWIVMNFPIGTSPQLCDVSGWCIPKNSKHKTGAIKFIKYISNTENSKYFAQTGLIIPANKKASQIIKNNHNEQVFLDIIKYTDNTNVSKNYKKITDEINKKYDL